jgi:nucleotide sugar dehydrogenase
MPAKKVDAFDYDGRRISYVGPASRLSLAPDGLAYVLPGPEEAAREKERVRRLASEAKSKGMEVVVVQGLGFVGAIMASIVAHAEGKFVIGLQRPSVRSYWKIPLINSARTPVESEDPKVAQLIRETVSAGRFTATFVDDAISLADVVVSDVQCDVRKLRFGDSDRATVEIQAFIQATGTVARLIRPEALYLVETTVPPGTTEYIVKPMFVEEFKRRISHDLDAALKAGSSVSPFLSGLGSELTEWLRSPTKTRKDRLIDLALAAHPPRIAHSYERVMPGREYVDSVIDFPRVYAGTDDESAEMARRFLSSVLTGPRAELTRLPSPTDSEFSKCAENTYRATIIALGRVLGRTAEAGGVDLTKVVAAITKRPTHRDMLVPRTPSTGGYCLPKDPIFIVWSVRNMPNFKRRLTGERLRQLNRVLKMITLMVDINDTDGMHSVDIMEEELKALGKKLKGSRIVVAGASYREDVADTRYAPYEAIVRYLREKGAKVVVTDPYVKSLPELEQQDEDPYSMAKYFKAQKDLKRLRVAPDLLQVLRGSDGVIFAIPHEPYARIRPTDVAGAIGTSPDRFVVVDCGTFSGAVFEEFVRAGFKMRKMYHGAVNP